MMQVWHTSMKESPQFFVSIGRIRTKCLFIFDPPMTLFDQTYLPTGTAIFGEVHENVRYKISKQGTQYGAAITGFNSILAP